MSARWKNGADWLEQTQLGCLIRVLTNQSIPPSVLEHTLLIGRCGVYFFLGNVFFFFHRHCFRTGRKLRIIHHQNQHQRESLAWSKCGSPSCRRSGLWTCRWEHRLERSRCFGWRYPSRSRWLHPHPRNRHLRLLPLPQNLIQVIGARDKMHNATCTNYYQNNCSHTRAHSSIPKCIGASAREEILGGGKTIVF